MDHHWFRDVTAWFVLLAPALVFAFDMYVEHFVCHSATITAVVRGWHRQNSWAQCVYIVGVILLYLHFFCGWPDVPR